MIRRSVHTTSLISNVILFWALSNKHNDVLLTLTRDVFRTIRSYTSRNIVHISMDKVSVDIIDVCPPGILYGMKISRDFSEMVGSTIRLNMRKYAILSFSGLDASLPSSSPTSSSLPNSVCAYGSRFPYFSPHMATLIAGMKNMYHFVDVENWLVGQDTILYSAAIRFLAEPGSSIVFVTNYVNHGASKALLDHLVRIFSKVTNGRIFPMDIYIGKVCILRIQLGKGFPCEFKVMTYSDYREQELSGYSASLVFICIPTVPLDYYTALLNKH